MTYYLYHIPGKKVGVTTNLEERVHKQQGYYPGEYEIIETSEDIDFISAGEQIMQKCYGYKVDEVLYHTHAIDSLVVLQLVFSSFLSYLFFYPVYGISSIVFSYFIII